MSLINLVNKPFSRKLLRLNKSLKKHLFIKQYCSTRVRTFNEEYDILKSLGDGKVCIEKDEELGIATMTLDHINKKNAISGSMMAQLSDAVAQMENWDAGKGLILTGAGDIFCSGVDVSKATMGNSSEYGQLMSSFMHQVLNRLYCLPMVTVALINGKAIGGGSEISISTDFRLFSPSAEVHFLQGKMGVVPGWGGGTRLVKLVGARRALDILTTSQRITPERALEIGLADEVLPSSDHLVKSAKEWLQKRTQHDASVVRAMKRLVTCANNRGFEDSLRNERELFNTLWGGPANRKALSKLKQRLKT